MENKESNVDVLIVGAGPAGCMTANWLSRLGTNVRVVDKRNDRVPTGHADGLAPRSMEIFESFDMRDEICRYSIPMNELREWRRDENGLRRTTAGKGMQDGTTRWVEHLLNQGAIERAFENSISANSSIRVERKSRPISMTIDKTLAADPDAYAVRVEISRVEGSAVNGTSNGTNGSSNGASHANGENTVTEVIHAKYVVGCDGARSWVREQLGIPMEGTSTDSIWGVLDIWPITNFPDIRFAGTVQNEKGAILLIPREKNLIRIYAELAETHKPVSGKPAVDVTPQKILEVAQRTLAPYTIDYEYCDWWSCYQVGQRVGAHYADPHNRIFLAGDAVHTHSPKAGQGMNTSMQDGYNLGWKLGGVINHTLHPSILSTYEAERRPVAIRLIELDRELLNAYSDAEASNKIAEFYYTNVSFLLGTGIEYIAGDLVVKPPGSTTIPNQPNPVPSPFAKRIVPGVRLSSTQIVAHADSRLWDLHHLLPSTGVWRLIAFSGNVSQPAQMTRLSTLADRLTSPKSGILTKFPSSTLSVFTIHSAPPLDVEMLDFPPVFFPFDARLGYDYTRIFLDYHIEGIGGGKAYEFYGIDQNEGCLVLVRPDQHVAAVTSLEDPGEIEGLLGRCMIPVPSEGKGF